jgi:chorismate mutase
VTVPDETVTDKTDEVAPSTPDDDIQALRIEIDRLDAEILRLIKRRTEVSQTIGRARMAAGGPRIVYSREMAVLARFRELGSEGRDLALLLLRLGRGRLGANTPR